MRCAPARPVLACFVRSCCSVAVQEHDLRATPVQCKHFPHTSHCTLHTPHSTLHTCTSSQLISSELFSSYSMSSHMSAKFFLAIFMSSTSQYWCLLQKLAQTTSQYYFVLQSLHKLLPSTTLYYKACTKHVPVLLCTTKLAQNTFQYYFVLYKASTHIKFFRRAGSKWARVQSANALYRFTKKVVLACILRNIPFTVENPSRSRFWDTSFWKAVEAAHGDQLYIIDFQSCAFGGKRPKWTRLVSNRSKFLVLAKECPGDHQHLPWGFAAETSPHVFSTAEEAEYPRGLCQQMAQVVRSLALQQGYINNAGVKEAAVPLSASSRAAAGGVVKVSKMPSVVPEYKTQVLQPVSTLLAPNTTPASLSPEARGDLPLDAKLIQCAPSETDKGGDWRWGAQNFHSQMGHSVDSPWVCVGSCETGPPLCL